jgi:hypothetical protein
MALMRTARKDDIISLCYLMIIILNDNDLPCQNGALKELCLGNSGLPMDLQFDIIADYKKVYSLYEMSQNIRYLDYPYSSNLLKIKSYFGKFC